MRSPLGAAAALGTALINRAPVPFASRTPWQAPSLGRNDMTAQIKAMGGLGTLFAIVSRLAGSFSRVEWELYRSAASGLDEERERVTRHLALDLWNRPNPYHTGQEFREVYAQHLELAGEAWWVIARNSMMRSIPLELWAVRPDRMTVVTSPTDYLVGYIYTGPGGETVPLEIDDVIMIRQPDPDDPYRGMSAVRAILVDVDSARFGAEWNRNFFLNGAEPGGVIEVPTRLSDGRFKEMVARWREQHQGISNAHRVAVLEEGKWVDRKFTMRDMQFAELRNVSRDVIREAFGIPKFALGDVDDVNRATADASAAWFARELTIPRLERTDGALNNDFLPKFGTTGAGLEFDYCDPTPPDLEGERAERESVANAVKTYITDVGFKPKQILEFFDLPSDWELEPKPEPPAFAPAPAAPVPDEGDAAPAARGSRMIGLPHVVGRAAVRFNPMNIRPEDVDLKQVQEDWERALAALMRSWGDITAAQRRDIADQIRAAIMHRDPGGLAVITVDSAAGAALLDEAMQAHAELSAQRVIDEAEEQNVSVERGQADGPTMTVLAGVVAALLAAGLANAAAREALRRYSATADADQVAGAVDDHLAGLSDAFLADQLGAALTSAQNAGRVATLKLAPEGALYASEVMDRNTCPPCREVNGRWLGNISDLSTLDAAYPPATQPSANPNAVYPNGGYVDCQGGVRCRGTIVGVWRPKQVTSV